MNRNVIVIYLLGWAAGLDVSAKPLRLHPSNPHYFQFRGKPTIFLTSGEHYGAVLNLDFDYVKYLDTLARDGLNGTRIWSGAYCEPPTAFRITGNSLAPAPGRFICPWARSEQEGYANGGNKFDLSQWDLEYFKRLKDFIAQAGRRGVIVELNLFCPFYEETMWRLSPMHASNNINGLDLPARTNVYTLDKSGGLLGVQEALVRKLVKELRRYDNLYYEICNEPYFGGVTLAWQHHIAEVILDAETQNGSRHLISQNIANGKAEIVNPHSGISIFNFHYAHPPDAVAMNWALNKVIGENETGFQGTNDAPYRMEAWDFLMAGGGLFNNLDYSFSVGHEDGSLIYPADQPGGGNATLRRQLAGLRRFMSQFDFLEMRPDYAVVKAVLPSGTTIRTLAKPGEQYAIYLRTPVRQKSQDPVQRTQFAEGELVLEMVLPKGNYAAQWWEPKQGFVCRHEAVVHSGGTKKWRVPSFAEDIALAVKRTR